MQKGIYHWHETTPEIEYLFISDDDWNSDDVGLYDWAFIRYNEVHFGSPWIACWTDADNLVQYDNSVFKSLEEAKQHIEENLV